MGATRQYNKGEWTELYVLGRLLADGEFAVLGSESAGPEHRVRVLGTYRHTVESETGFAIEGDHVVGSGGLRIPRDLIRHSVDGMSKEIKKGSTGSRVFALKSGHVLLDLLNISHFKSANQKADIYLHVEDPLRGLRDRPGYTVKSFLGANPSLFNASKATRFTYLLDPTPSELEIEKLNQLSGERVICAALRKAGISLELCVDQVDAVFYENLFMLDSALVHVLGHLVATYYSLGDRETTSVEKLTTILSAQNPMDVRRPGSYYRLKVTEFLEAVALGMTPKAEWDGRWNAPGGLIIVNAEGSLTCVPLTDRDRHRDFLFQNSNFDRPAHDRSDFGKIYSAAGKAFIAANFQIRINRPTHKAR